MSGDSQTLEDWWKEDAARVNALSDSIANKIDVGEGDPPELNKDGSLKGTSGEQN